MKKFLTCLIVGALASGCASTPNPWIGLETETEPATRPLDCGKFPFPSDFNDERVVYDQAGVNDLEAYRLCSEANEEIAKENANTVDQLKVVRKGLTEAGQAQRSIADMRLEMLEDERKHHMWQSIGYWIAIIGMGFAL